MSHGKLCQDLFFAIDRGDTKGLADLLKQGADPNSRNGLGFAPIYMAAATHQSDAVDVLLKGGAKPDLPSTYGTPLSFACMTGNLPDAQKFLALGANPKYQRTDGMTPLMMAANSGNPALVQELIGHKVDVNTQDDGGVTALAIAARNDAMPVGQALVATGANLELPDEDGQTPLMTAAASGQADFVSMLLAKGAKPNAKDTAGRTALVIAADYGDYPEVVKALLKGNANPKAKDAKGRTAGQIAAFHGFAQTAALLHAGPVATEPSRTPSQAVAISLKLIESSTGQFAEATTCVSCHQEGLGRITTAEAQAHGFKLDPKVDRMEKDRIMGMLMGTKPLHERALKDPNAMKQLPLIEINEVTTADSWVLAGLAAQNEPPSEATAAMTMVLAKQQSKDGCWTFALPREPMQSSFFTFTALSVRALNTYAPKSDAAEVADRIGRAKAWLMSAKVQNSEDRASKLLGLKWSGAEEQARKDAAAAILADQRPDGGWAQLPNLQSDAYATGQALYALRESGEVSPDDSAYKKGVRYLLLTQDDDGSWLVTKRAMAANNYFDAGFPHGESQYASFNGTCWATLALLGSTNKR